MARSAAQIAKYESDPLNWDLISFFDSSKSASSLAVKLQREGVKDIRALCARSHSDVRAEYPTETVAIAAMRRILRRSGLDFRAA